jgi:LuxR family maltose regulon positive regulatory protein
VEALQPRSSSAGDRDVVLSEREREIARFLPTPLTNAEIASQLYISLNTLKTHLRSIYRKFDVRSRDAASKRAQELGLA